MTATLIRERRPLYAWAARARQDREERLRAANLKERQKRLSGKKSLGMCVLDPE